jgi:ATP-dependent DNA helicase RecG
LRKLTFNALQWMENEKSFHELLPASLLEELTLPTCTEALQFIHRPPRETDIAHLIENKTLSQKRLVFEELLAHRISLLHVKQTFQSRIGVPLSQYQRLSTQFRKLLPFQLTSAQERVAQEIREDLRREHPMLRLVQGDVGSGKTVIAALAMLQAVENGYQAAMMAPTELLAEQHYRVFKEWLEPLGVKFAFLSGSVKTRARTAALEAIQKGEAEIILGTHALFQNDVIFSRLALVIVDEQHRFGVHQRALFREKGVSADFFPHQLVMTATPIPRTLAMSFYADLDCSLLDELPKGRIPIVTSVLANSKRDEVVARIRETCKQSRQAYWVCPLIEESDVLACQAAIKTAEELQQTLPELNIGLIHGRMNAEQKELAMYAFQQGETHLLVATTVIEVGVDVPNASVIVIENAERLGLSQLHQLRGRVGRGSAASHCVLLYQSPLSDHAKERLTVMRETGDGFKIAQRDLELRGPGEVLGTRQTGELTFRVADLLRDRDMLSHVQKAAEIIMQEHEEVIEPLVNRWLKKNVEYGKV